jgi:DNA-binding response OmpR family regulator
VNINRIERMAEVLYADDDEAVRGMIGATLNAAGYAVRLAANGREALEEVGRRAPDLVLLDYHMGTPDGFAVCRAIKDDPHLAHLPVLILTGEGRLESRLQGFDAGADDYLAKPVDPRELVARVRALLALTRRGLDRNPTSGLPGGEAIQREFERRRDRDQTFAVCYLDLDNFKPFGERFGFLLADEVIGEVGEVLRLLTQGSDDFAGHVGGDDFVLLCEPAQARARVEEAQARFRERLAARLPEEVVRAGGYTGKNREGTVQQIPLTELSVAIIRVDPRRTPSLHLLAEVVAEVKDRAKQSGSGGIVETDFPG